jgi:hypothetical protein
MHVIFLKEGYNGNESMKRSCESTRKRLQSIESGRSQGLPESSREMAIAGSLVMK